MFPKLLIKLARGGGSWITAENLGSKPSLLNMRSISSKAPNQDPADSTATTEKASKSKPNLRKAAAKDGPRAAVLIACILATIWMYPMIFKPLFGIGSLGKFIDSKVSL